MKEDYIYKKIKPDKLEEFKSIEPIVYENRPSKWDDFVDWFDVEHRLTRGQVIFIGATICYIASPEFGKFIIQSGVPAFLKYYGAAILAGIALFMLTRSDKS